MVATATMALAISASGAYAASMDFTVVEGGVPGANPTAPFTADDITAKYEENLLVTPATATTGSFSAFLLVNFTSYVDNGGLKASQLDANVGGAEGAATNLYSMYALVTVTGTYEQSLSPDSTILTTDFKPGTATANVWIDPNRDTVNNYLTATTTSGGSDDQHILTASAISPYPVSNGSVRQYVGGDPNVLPNGYVIGGQYALNFTNPQILGIGTGYWPSLSSLSFLMATASGDVDTTGQGSVFPGDIKGDTDITFTGVAAVPEPASLVLLGTGLLSAGAARRRAKNKKQ